MVYMNLYYSPELFGLEVVADVEALGGYEFDKFVVWKDKDGTYYWDSDSGCSCPVPFESSHPAELAKGTARDALTDLLAWAGGQYEYQSERRTKESRHAVAILEDLAGVNHVAK